MVNLDHIVLPKGWKLPECDHPIEKWCSNCDRDSETYDKIPHFKKYSQLHTWTDAEFIAEMENK
jgi:hypothetical protein|tara:strand:- start:2156 stop:2347 length:192 start_codon:yes stop_codon:yes gene_type:complete